MHTQSLHTQSLHTQTDQPIRRAGRPTDHRPRRLFCFPPAGAGASIFYPWLDLDNSDIDVCPIAMPGKEDRFREAPPESIHSHADVLATQLRPYLDRPFAVLGYSMGALYAYELVLRWYLMGAPLPDLFIALSARAPGTQVQRHPPLHLLPPAEFRQQLLDLGGTSNTILQDPQAMALFEPILRHDFKLSELYHRQTLLPLPCPVLALHGAEDTLVSAAQMHAWQDCTRARFQLQTLPEKHMFQRETLRQLPAIFTPFWDEISL